jgi:hypothetical protein
MPTKKYISKGSFSPTNRREKMKRLWVLSLLVLLLTSCVPITSTDTRISLQPNEKWLFEIHMLISQADNEVYALVIQQTLNETIYDLRSSGLEAEWRREQPDPQGNVPYVVTVRGQGYEQINNELFEGERVILLDKKTKPYQVNFRLYPETDLMVGEQTYTLRGGRILSSNGTQIDKHTVKWTNPTNEMEATLALDTVLSKVLPYLFWIGGGITVLVIGLTVSRMNRKSRCQRCGASIPSKAEFCPRCGAHR